MCEAAAVNEIDRRFEEIWGKDRADSSRALNWIRNAERRRQSEDLYLDFKEKAGTGSFGDEEDCANLAKAISGFANTEGGLIVWGVVAKKDTNEDDDADVVKGLRPVSDLAGFKAWLDDECHKRSTPPVPGIFACAVADPAGSNTGYVIVLIPKRRDILVQAEPPRRSKTAKGYYLRSGSGFHVYPPSMIAEFYSRRPLPLLRCEIRLSKQDKPILAEERTILQGEELGALATFAREVDAEYEQYVEIPWIAELQNEGRGTAEEIAYDIQVEGIHTCNVLEARYKQHQHSLSQQIAFEPEPIHEFKSVSGRASGRIAGFLHPGQRKEIANGFIRLPLRPIDGSVSPVSISVSVYCLDSMWNLTEFRRSESELREEFGPSIQRLLETAPARSRRVWTQGRRLTLPLRDDTERSNETSTEPEVP